MAQELSELERRDGTAYRLTELPWPDPLHTPEGRRLPATYANFLVTNQAVLVPIYGVPQDNEACETLGACFPGRQVRPVHCRPLLAQGAAFIVLPCSCHRELVTMNSKHGIPCAAVQQQCGADRESNLAATAELIEQAADRGARLVVLQELHATPYFCQTEDVAVLTLQSRFRARPPVFSGNWPPSTMS